MSTVLDITGRGCLRRFSDCYFNSDQHPASEFNEPPLVALGRRMVVKHSDAARFDAGREYTEMLTAKKRLLRPSRCG
jgi:hypothetical protein